jgi:hypothetical protein
MHSIYTTPHIATTTAALFQKQPAHYQTCPPYGWWEATYYHFRFLAAHFGITVNVDRTSFSGFYHEGAGCSYEAEIAVTELLACWRQKRWQTVVADHEMTIPEILIDPTIMEQLENGTIQAHGHVRALKYKTRIYVAMQFQYPDPLNRPYRQLDEQIEGFIDAVIALCDELNQVLFARLLQAYETLSFPSG